MKVFVYATLKKKKILEDALGHPKKMTPAYLQGYIEKPVSYDNQSWPTLFAMKPDHMVEGEVFDATDEELTKLDKWEANYQRQLVRTSEGPAYVYIFRRPGLKAALGSVARFRDG